MLFLHPNHNSASTPIFYLPVICGKLLSWGCILIMNAERKGVGDGDFGNKSLLWSNQDQKNFSTKQSREIT